MTCAFQTSQQGRAEEKPRSTCYVTRNSDRRNQHRTRHLDPWIRSWLQPGKGFGKGESGLYCLGSGTVSPAVCWDTSWKERGRFWLPAGKTSPRLTPDYTVDCHHTKPCTLSKELGPSFSGGESPGLTDISSGQRDASCRRQAQRGGCPAGPAFVFQIKLPRSRTQNTPPFFSREALEDVILKKPSRERCHFRATTPISKYLLRVSFH